MPLSLVRRDRWAEQEPTWRQARPAVINAALHRAQDRLSGNWFVLAGSREVRRGRPFGRTVGGVEVVAWRGTGGELHAGPGACPHLGAPLDQAAVHQGQLICRWHGMSLGGRGTPGWCPFPAHDDGVLAWVQLDEVGGEQRLPEPVVPQRPPLHASIDSVMTLVGTCEPQDVVANRLDPWHGAWFHPYSFTALRVLSAPPVDCPPAEDRFLVEVTFTVGKRYGVPVFAEFSCPEPRTVTMEIVDGEGAGSVVETHATPLRPGPDGLPRTAVIEAVVAHSDRPGFRHASRVAAAVRPLVATAAKRLWRDDIAYAERRYALRAARGA
jgi:hypothetical protein